MSIWRCHQDGQDGQGGQDGQDGLARIESFKSTTVSNLEVGSVPFLPSACFLPTEPALPLLEMTAPNRADD